MTFWQFIWGMVYIYCVFIVIWMFIRVFTDIFRREDLSGFAKAMWILLLFVLPLISILVYMILRPKMTPQDVHDLAAMDAAQKAVAGLSPTDEIAKAAELRDQGHITAEEFDAIKKKVLA
jgi:hypothetical protein